MNQEMTFLATSKRIQQDVPTAIFEQYAPALYKYAFRFYQSAMIADRVVGDIFARFLEQLSIGRYSGINLRLDLYIIAYDILVREARYCNYFVPAESKILKHADPMVQDIEDPQLFRNLQHALLHKLTDDQRHVVILRFVEGFSIKETALITGKKVGTVKVIQNRGIAALRKALGYGAVETHSIAIYIRQMSYA
jgi:RNA polymerase sigma-70 factor, ECF subfamily